MQLAMFVYASSIAISTHNIIHTFSNYALVIVIIVKGRSTNLEGGGAGSGNLVFVYIW